jgi:class 3 adenylate cyclase
VSIRWKLFLSLFALTTGAIALVLVVAEYEFREWVRGEVEQRFEAELAELLTDRDERLLETKGLCATLAEESELRAILKGEGSEESKRAFLKKFFEASRVAQAMGGRPPAEERSARPGGSGRNNPKGALGGDQRPAGGNRAGGGQVNAAARQGKNQSRGLPVLGVIDLEGQVTHLGRAVNRARPGREKAAKRLTELQQQGDQVVGYMVLEGEEDHRTMVKEVVVTPILEGGKLLGMFFLGRNAETQVERSFQASEESPDRGGRFGLVVEGQWFLKGFSEEALEEIEGELEADFWSERTPQILKAGGASYMIVGSDLNPGSLQWKGYEVALFPVDSLITALLSLRETVAWLGLGTVAVLSIISLVLSQRFSKPIAALVAGTERIRSGDLSGEVKVNSTDEFGVLATAFNAMTQDLALKERYHEVLGKVSDPVVAQQLMEGQLELGGEVRTAAVLFCDIRGFTAMTEGMDPAEVIEFMNEHMTALTKVVHAHGGVVDKFVGDLIMAVFGAPQSREDDALRAARCALEMMAERQRLNETTGRVVEVGTGLAYGKLVAGCMGSIDRLNYTVLGDRVNLAARLCSAAGIGEVIVDEAIAASLDESMQAEAREPILLKGFAQPMASFALSFREGVK